MKTPTPGTDYALTVHWT